MSKTLSGTVDGFLGDDVCKVPPLFRKFLKRVCFSSQSSRTCSLNHLQIMDTPQETRPTFEELKNDPFFDE